MTQEAVGQRLKRLRLAADLSQRELAAPGVSYAYISRIEAGTRQPSVKALRKLAAKLGVSTAYLESGVDRTETDDLTERLLKRTGSDTISVTLINGVPVGMALTFSYAGEQRTVGGHGCLTEALLAALAWTDTLDRLRAERDHLEVEQRRLEEVAR